MSASKTKELLSAEIERLVQESMKHPGVADVIQVYERARDKTESVKPYIRAVSTQQSFSVTDSVSY